MIIFSLWKQTQLDKIDDLSISVKVVMLWVVTHSNSFAVSVSHTLKSECKSQEGTGEVIFFRRRCAEKNAA